MKNQTKENREAMKWFQSTERSFNDEMGRRRMERRRRRMEERWERGSIYTRVYGARENIGTNTASSERLRAVPCVYGCVPILMGGDEHFVGEFPGTPCAALMCSINIGGSAIGTISGVHWLQKTPKSHLQTTENSLINMRCQFLHRDYYIIEPGIYSLMVVFALVGENTTADQRCVHGGPWP